MLSRWSSGKPSSVSVLDWPKPFCLGKCLHLEAARTSGWGQAELAFAVLGQQGCATATQQSLAALFGSEESTRKRDFPSSPQQLLSVNCVLLNLGALNMYFHPDTWT